MQPHASSQGNRSQTPASEASIAPPRATSWACDVGSRVGRWVRECPQEVVVMATVTKSDDLLDSHFTLDLGAWTGST
jgi:hypothetical protein